MKDWLDIRRGAGGTPVGHLLIRSSLPLTSRQEAVDRSSEITLDQTPHRRPTSATMTGLSPYDLRLSGSRIGDDPGWTDRWTGQWLTLFLGLGVLLRLLRFGLNFPLWNDESYVALNIQERDFVGLMRPLDYAQVCPLLFLWLEKSVTLAIGFSEWSLRLVPTIASIASLFLFRHVAGRLLTGGSLTIAVAFLAAGYSPIRYGGEVKPYASDFLIALGLISLAVEWIRTPERTHFLWGLAALGPLAVGISNPAIFIAVSVGLVLMVPVLKTRSPRAIAALAVFGLGTAATFIVLLRSINGPQSDHVISWMIVYWTKSFPPRSPMPLLGWLVDVHTGNMFAYPAGGVQGASTLTTVLVAFAILAYIRRGSKTVLALLLTPFAFGLVAAALGRYPYGGSARTMQYVAPAIHLMAGLGAGVLLARLPQPLWRERAQRWVLTAMLFIGLGMIAWDVTHPFKAPFFQGSRELARRFWAEESAGAELVCARNDLRLPLNPFRWQGDREVSYLCHQAIYSPRHAAGQPLLLDRVSPSHPLRVVVFNETQSDAKEISRWISANANHYELLAKREHLLDQVLRRGKSVVTDRYVVYEFVPAQVTGASRPRISRPPKGDAVGAGQLATDKVSSNTMKPIGFNETPTVKSRRTESRLSIPPR